MLATSLKQVEEDLGPGFTMCKKSLGTWIDNMNAKAEKEKNQVICTSWKREATEQLVLKMPGDAFSMALVHYRAFTWERCCLNTEMLRTAVWGLHIQLLLMHVMI